MAKLPKNFFITSNPLYKVKVGDMFNPIGYDDYGYNWFPADINGGLQGETIANIKLKYPKIIFAIKSKEYDEIGQVEVKPFKFPPAPDGFRVMPRHEAMEYTFKEGDYFIREGKNDWENISCWSGYEVKKELGHYKNFAVAVKEKPDTHLKIEEITDLKYIFVNHIKYFYTTAKDENSWCGLPPIYYGRTVKKFQDDNGKDYRLGKQKPRFESPRDFPFGY